MNYYERHLGDYARDTAHLSAMEVGIYDLLLDRYYATEAGIPVEMVHAVARVRSKQDKAIADGVLRQYFYILNGAWMHKKCEEVIQKYREKSAKAAASAHRRWDAKAMPTHSEGMAIAPETHAEGISEKHANQYPVTSTQKETDRPRKRGSRLPQPFMFPDAWRAEAVRVGGLQVSIEGEFAKFCDHWWAKSGKDATKDDWLATWRNWIRRSCEFAGAKAPPPAPKVSAPSCCLCPRTATGRHNGASYCATHLPESRVAA